jgi:hypothetical protein
VPPVRATLVSDLACSSLRLAAPDNAFLARRSPPIRETACPDPPFAGMLEVLAPCSGTSVPLLPRKLVVNCVSDRFRTTGTSPSLTYVSPAGSLVASRHLTDSPKLPAPCCKIYYRHPFGKGPPFSFRSLRPVLMCLLFIMVPQYLY